MLAEDVEEADFSGGRGVSAAAKLDTDGRSAGPEDANLIAVFFIEEGNGTLFNRFLIGHLFIIDRQVLPDFIIDDALHLFQFRRGHGGEMGEVKAEPLRGDQRTPLPGMVTQHLAEGKVEQVGGGVVAGDIQAPFRVNCRGNFLADGQFTLDDVSLVDDNIRRNANRIGNQKLSVSAVYFTGITHLSAHLGIERGTLQNKVYFLPFPDSLHGLVVNHQRGEVRPVAETVIADKFTRFQVELFFQVVEPFFGQFEPVAGPCLFFLLRHLPLKAGRIHGKTALPGNFPGQLHGKTVGVI